MDGKNYEMIWTDNPNHKDRRNNGLLGSTYNANKQTRMYINIVDDNVPGIDLCGDLFFRLVNAKSNQLICRFAINTSFVSASNSYVLDKRGVDPDSIAQDKRFENNFRIELRFEDVCQTCKPENELGSVCSQCSKNPQMKKEF